MLLRYLQLNLVALLVFVGLVLPLPASVFAQSDEEPTVPLVGNHHVFLPVVQTDSDNIVNVADDSGFDYCRLAHANAVLTMGPGVSEVNSTSPNAAYGMVVGCKKWVVDILVPSNSSGTGNELRSIAFVGDSSAPANKALCQSYSAYESYYKKAAGQTEYTRVATQWIIGLWHEGNMFPCELYFLTGTGSIPRPNPPRAGTDVYRVAKSIEYGGQWRQVYVAAEHPSPAP